MHTRAGGSSLKQPAYTALTFWKSAMSCHQSHSYREVDGALDDVLEAAARLAQDARDVLEDLVGLVLDGVRGELVGLRVEADLPGEVGQSVEDLPDGVGADRLGTRGQLYRCYQLVHQRYVWVYQKGKEWGGGGGGGAALPRILVWELALTYVLHTHQLQQPASPLFKVFENGGFATLPVAHFSRPVNQAYCFRGVLLRFEDYLDPLYNLRDGLLLHKPDRLFLQLLHLWRQRRERRERRLALTRRELLGDGLPELLADFHGLALANGFLLFGDGPHIPPLDGPDGEFLGLLLRGLLLALHFAILMNVKVLVETLTEIPDEEMLDELLGHFREHRRVTLPDLGKVFALLSALFGNRDRGVVRRAQQLTEVLCSFLVATEVEQAWAVCAGAVIRALGFEDEQVRFGVRQVRKSVKAAVLAMLKKTRNPLLFLDSLNKLGLESESQLVAASSMKVICKVLAFDVDILKDKASLPAVKLALEKLILFTRSPQPLLKEQSRCSLVKLFYVGVKNLEEVITRLDGHFRESLEAVWRQEKEKVGREGEAGQRESREVRFEQLPLVNKKVFGVFQPLLIERLLKQLSTRHYGHDPPSEQLFGHDARKACLLEFRLGFELHFDRLVQFLLPLYRLLVAMLAQEVMLEEVVEMVGRVLAVPAINNRVVVGDSVRALLRLLNSQRVPLRKKVKNIISALLPTNTFKFLDIYQETLDGCRNDIQWYCVYQLLDLCEDLLVCCSQCHPPVFDRLFHSICFYLDSPIVRVRNKSLGALAVLVNFHPAYREMMGENVSPETVGMVEDKIQRKEVKGFGRKGETGGPQGRSEYDMDFERERQAYLQYLASKDPHKTLD